MLQFIYGAAVRVPQPFPYDARVVRVHGIDSLQRFFFFFPFYISLRTVAGVRGLSVRPNRR